YLSVPGHLLSFPTRRSSDLVAGDVEQGLPLEPKRLRHSRSPNWSGSLSAGPWCCRATPRKLSAWPGTRPAPNRVWLTRSWATARSEEHTSELQSRENLVCRL